MRNTKWFRWEKRKIIPNKKQPGVYFIAVSKKDISDEDYSLIKEIIYIGMSKSKKGINRRLNQFNRGMKKVNDIYINGVHGGAERVRNKYRSLKHFSKKAYVSVKFFPLADTTKIADIHRQYGKCIKHEYDSIADYFDKHGILPKFNNPDSKKLLSK